MPASAGVVSASRLPSFNGGAFTATSIYQAAQIVAQGTATTPVAGTGNITITDSQFPFPYDYHIRNGNQTISSFTATDWFTNTADRAAFIIVKGNLSFSSSGITFIPPVRKLMTVILVTGSITYNSTTFSMSSRGATHASMNLANASGGFRVIDQTVNGTTMIINYAGGTGGIGRSSSGDTAGASGGTGSNSGGGGGGGMATATSGALSGVGARGTAFGGGAGGGGRRYSASASSAIDAVANGGKGGDAIGAGPVGGGGGNPGGTGLNGGGTGATGTGGTLVMFVLKGSTGVGSFTAQGANGGTADTPGGGSGGGYIGVIAKNAIVTSYGTINTNGGTGPSSWGGPSGGSGGSGTISIQSVTFWA